MPKQVRGPEDLLPSNFILPLTRSMSSISVCQASSSRLVLRIGWGLKVLCAVGSSIWPKSKSGSEKGVTRLTNKKKGGVPASGAEGTVFDRARSNTLLRVAFQRRPSLLPSNLPKQSRWEVPLDFENQFAIPLPYTRWGVGGVTTGTSFEIKKKDGSRPEALPQYFASNLLSLLLSTGREVLHGSLTLKEVLRRVLCAGSVTSSASQLSFSFPVAPLVLGPGLDALLYVTGGRSLRKKGCWDWVSREHSLAVLALQLYSRRNEIFRDLLRPRYRRPLCGRWAGAGLSSALSAALFPRP